MKKGDTVRVISNFDAPDQKTVPQGTITRLCAVNDIDKLGTIDMGDRMAVVPMVLLKVEETKEERENAKLVLRSQSEPKHGETISNVVKEKQKRILERLGDDKGLRFNSGKPKLHRVPYELMKGAAEGFEYGAGKYPDWNWTKPIEFSSPFNSLLRHLWAWWWGEDFDKESGVHHLKLAAANISMLLYHLEHNSDQDDRPQIKD